MSLTKLSHRAPVLITLSKLMVIPLIPHFSVAQVLLWIAEASDHPPLGEGLIGAQRTRSLAGAPGAMAEKLIASEVSFSNSYLFSASQQRGVNPQPHSRAGFRSEDSSELPAAAFLDSNGYVPK